MKRTSTHTTKLSEVTRKWYLVDASGKTLGRVATAVAHILMGKGKVIFTKHIDTGDFIVLINASKIKVTGKKETDKTYFSHSGYPGGDKLLNFTRVMKQDPSRVITQAVWGMLPQNRLGRVMLKKLKIYSGSKHENISQKPEALEI
jgi:large subunit ribosomal protein L13